MKTVIALALCLTLAAGFALALEFTVTPVDDAMVLSDLRSDDPDCTVGNPDDVRWGFAWTVPGAYDYAIRINLMGHPSVCDCPDSPPFPVGAWALRNIGWILQFDGGVATQLQVALYGGTSTSGPVTELYASDPALGWFTVDTTGYYWFNIAFTGDEYCIADAPAQHYYLVVRHLDANVLRWVVGEMGPMPQYKNFVNLNDGEGWKDLQQWLGGDPEVGNLTIYADVDCCLGGVQTEESSLSEIKRLFR